MLYSIAGAWPAMWTHKAGAQQVAVGLPSLHLCVLVPARPHTDGLQLPPCVCPILPRQICSATSRLLVHERIAPAFFVQLKKRAESIKVHPAWLLC